MSSTIKAIERHMTLPGRSGRSGELGPQSKAVSVQSGVAKLVAEWQQRGPETLSGHVVQKLRLVLAPTQSVMPARVAG